MRFSPSMVFSSSPAALLLAAPSLAWLFLVLRGMQPALPLSRPGLASLQSIAGIIRNRDIMRLEGAWGASLLACSAPGKASWLQAKSLHLPVRAVRWGGEKLGTRFGDPHIQCLAA